VLRINKLIDYETAVATVAEEMLIYVAMHVNVSRHTFAIIAND